MTRVSPPKPPSSLTKQLQAFLTSPLPMVLIAFGLRLGAMVCLQSFHIPSENTFNFGFETGRIARAIASGEGFSSPLHGPSGPTAWISPVYPYLLAGIFQVFGIYSTASAVVALTLNSLFSALTCATIYAIGRRTFGPQVAAWAGWTWALFPYAVWWSVTWIWATSLLAFLLSLVFLVALGLERGHTAKAWLGFGLLWGLVALTDTALLSTLPFFLGWLCYRLRQQGMALRPALSAFTLASVLVVSPWLVRNYLTFGEFVFIRGNFGFELHHGNHKGSTGLRQPWLVPANNPREMEKFRRMGELPYVAEKKHQAVDFIMTHPSKFIRLTLKRVVRFWTGTSPQLIWIFGQLGEFVVAKYVVFMSVSIAAFGGLFFAFRTRHPAAALFAIPLIVYPLTYYITHPHPRYRHPIEPAMVLLAVYAVTSIFSRPSLRKGERAEALNPPATPREPTASLSRHPPISVRT